MHVRFIELMPMGAAAAAAKALFYPATAARQQLAAELGCQIESGPGPATTWRVGRGTVGFIPAVSDSFCASCNRLRLTARGRLRPCLTSDIEVDLTAALSDPHPLTAVQQVLREAVVLKPRQGGHLTAQAPSTTEMSCVGG